MSLRPEGDPPAVSVCLRDFELRFISMIVEAFECSDYRVFEHGECLFIQLLATRFFHKIAVVPDVVAHWVPEALGPDPGIVFTDAELVSRAAVPGFSDWLTQQFEIRSRH